MAIFLKTPIITYFDLLATDHDYCTDTESWDDEFGNDCSYYIPMCRAGAVLPGNENNMGLMYNYPELNCCVCGKERSGTQMIYKRLYHKIRSSLNI